MVDLDFIDNKEEKGKQTRNDISIEDNTSLFFYLIVWSDRTRIIEKPVGPSERVCTVPFRRDADFVHRQSILDQMHEKSTLPASRVALVGLGGVG